MVQYKPRIVISRCLNIEPVRYNGGIINDEFSKKLLDYVEYIAVCPEVDIGMPVPRPTVLLYKKGDQIRMIEPNSMKDYTDEMLEFSKTFLKSLGEVDGFLLKAKSPSCGVKDTKLYQENLKGLINGRSSGLFAQKAMEYYPYLPIEDEGRLNDYWIRRDFLTKIFSHARFRYLKNNYKDINDLLKFHQEHKYLLMLYDPHTLKQMGNLLANWKKYGLDETMKRYESLFHRVLSKRSNSNKHSNVLQHIYGHLSEKISDSEKRHLLKMLDKLRKGKLQLETLLEYIKGFIYRFNDKYLQSQIYLNPFPEELI
jgi:uncharacterized protein YbbK (DUF523 family)/uncharacterized protein YbgA (DUF1722 family)